MEEIQNLKRERRKFRAKVVLVNRQLLQWLAKAKHWRVLKKLLRALKEAQGRKEIGAENSFDESQLRLALTELESANLDADAEVMYDDIGKRAA